MSQHNEWIFSHKTYFGIDARRRRRRRRHRIFTKQQHRTTSNNAARKFGTPLRSNADKLQRFTQSSLKKKVRVRRTPQSKSANKSKAATVEKFNASTAILRLSSFSPIGKSSSSPTERTVVLSPGPVGFQLEPANKSPMYGCRITRFVDGGPNNPGQARMSGSIEPGDLVLKAESEGSFKEGSTYDDIISVLQQSDTKRVITVQSTLESQGFTPAKRRSPMNAKDSDGDGLQSTSKLSEEKAIDEASPKSNNEHDMFDQSPFQNALTSLPYHEESPSQTSPIRNRTILAEAAKGPIIVPLGIETKNTPFLDSVSKSLNSSFSSQGTAKSSNKSSASPPRQFLADDFFLFDGLGGAFEPYTPQVSNDSAPPRVDSANSQNEDNEIEQENIDHFDTTEQQQQPENSATDDHQGEDITKAEIKRQQNLFEDSLARADYEQRLQVVRRQHSKAEREWKDLYIHTCEKSESQIRELQIGRDVLENALAESKMERSILTDTRVKELEKQVAEAETFKMRTLVQAREKIRAKTNEYSRLVKAKENEWRKKFAALEDVNNDLQEQSDSRLVELNMSRTMVIELESRMIASETEKEEIANRLEKASCSIQNLKESIYRIEEEDEAKKRVIENTQEKLNKVLKENETLVGKIESHESFKKESSVLTEKLANSVREKQKAVNESQSISSKLEAENDDLTKQIVESTSDVEQLVQEKLLLEDKLALTWKNIEKAKNDASTIHETLLEKLENGQYYTSADIEEKEIAIQALEAKVKAIRGIAKENLIKSNKKTVLRHLQLREAERKLLETELLNVKIAQERDDLQQRSFEKDVSLAESESQVLKVTEMYKNEMVSVNELKVRLEAASKSKAESDSKYKKSTESLSLQLASKKSEFSSCEERLNKMESLKNNTIATVDELKAEIEGVTRAREEADLEYMQSIESLSLQLESNRSELVSLEGRISEMVSLKKKQDIATTNLEAQLEAMTHSKDEAESHYQKSIESLSSELELKRKESSDQLNVFKNELKERVALFQDEKEYLATKYEDQIEALGARLQIEGEKLSFSKQTEKKLLQRFESLTIEKKKEIEESKEKIEDLTDAIQSQCEELSCMEMRSQILEDDYTDAKSAHEKALKRIDAITREKNEVESNQEEEIKRLTSELQSKQSLFETTESDLKQSIDTLTSKIEEARLQYREDIKELNDELETLRIELSSATTKLKQFEDAGFTLNAIDELRMTIQTLKSENESISTQYWESIQELTIELQDQTEELSNKESIIEDMEEDIESSKIKIQELEHENFQKDILAGDMGTKIAAQTKLLDCSAVEKSQKDELISSLQSRIHDLEQDTSDKLELQNSHDDLKKTVADLQTSKDKMSVGYCSEIFRLVKRVAILDQTHSDVNAQRLKAMEIAMAQRKLQTQTKSQVEKLEKKLQTTSDQAVQLENKLKHNLNMQKEKENQVAIELEGKSKQLVHQNVTISSLQVEVSSMIRLTENLKESKERELNELKAANENLQSELSSEKISNSQSAGNVSDARMELKMLDKKFSSVISSKDEALLRSENNRTIIARSLLHANAVVASLRVQLKEKDRYLIADEQLKQATEKIDLLNQTTCALQGKLNDQDMNVDKLVEEVIGLNDQLVLLQNTRGKDVISRQASEEGFKRRILKLRAHYISKHITVQTLEKDVSNLNLSGSTNKKKIDELEEINARISREMKKMSENITENEHQNEQLQRAMKVFDEKLFNGEGNNKEIEADEIKSKDKNATRLLKNIEHLSFKLLFLEESMKQGEILHRDSEESLKKSISKLRAEYVSKHLETNDLKKQIAVLRQGRKLTKKNTEELRTTISNLQAELESSNIALYENETLTKELMQKISLLENGRKELLQSKDKEISLLIQQKKKEVESSLLEKELESEQLHEKILLLQNSLANEQKKVKEGESNRESDTENFLTLKRECQQLSSRVEIMDQEKCAMSDTISRQERRLRTEEEKFNQEIAGELTRLREKVGTLEGENFAKTSSLAELNSTLESIRDRFRDLLGQKNDLEERFAIANNELTRYQKQVDERQENLVASDNARIDLERDLSALRTELQHFKDRGTTAENKIESSRSDPSVLDNEMSAHLSSVKDAFNIQAAVLEDVKLSESMLETLINEVMNLAAQSESEMLELSSVLGTVDDLLLNPSSLLASLDLAGLDSSECYFGEVRSRLEALAALAYTTSVELNTRQNQLTQWRSNRAESPVIPATPPSSKQLNRSLFDLEEVNDSSDITPVITDGAKEVRDKFAGARLLSCVLENNNKKKLASAFRKWSCAAGVINASANASRIGTAAELAHELKITREKLMALKTHLKTGRGGKQKPRLRRILERLDGNVLNRANSRNSKTNTNDYVPVNMDHTSREMNNYSFEL